MSRRALTIVELLVVIAVIAILFGLLWPAVQVSRSGVKRSVCQNNLRQIALAATNYQSVHLHFPACTGSMQNENVGSSDQLNALVELLPFMDEADRYKRITEGCTIKGKTFPPFPALSTSNYEPWEVSNPIFVCQNVPDFETGFAQTHYGFCIGDRARNIELARGLTKPERIPGQ